MAPLKEKLTLSVVAIGAACFAGYGYGNFLVDIVQYDWTTTKEKIVNTGKIMLGAFGYGSALLAATKVGQMAFKAWKEK